MIYNHSSDKCVFLTFSQAFTKMINKVPTGETYTFTDVTPSPAAIPTTRSGPNNNNICAWARDSSV